MKWNYPKCKKKIESNYMTSEVIIEIFDHEKSHK